MKTRARCAARSAALQSLVASFCSGVRMMLSPFSKRHGNPLSAFRPKLKTYVTLTKDAIDERKFFATELVNVGLTAEPTETRYAFHPTTDGPLPAAASVSGIENPESTLAVGAGAKPAYKPIPATMR